MSRGPLQGWGRLLSLSGRCSQVSGACSQATCTHHSLVAALLWDSSAARGPEAVTRGFQRRWASHTQRPAPAPAPRGPLAGPRSCSEGTPGTLGGACMPSCCGNPRSCPASAGPLRPTSGPRVCLVSCVVSYSVTFYLSWHQRD